MLRGSYLCSLGSSPLGAPIPIPRLGCWLACPQEAREQLNSKKRSPVSARHSAELALAQILLNPWPPPLPPGKVLPCPHITEEKSQEEGVK